MYNATIHHLQKDVTCDIWQNQLSSTAVNCHICGSLLPCPSSKQSVKLSQHMFIYYSTVLNIHNHQMVDQFTITSTVKYTFIAFVNAIIFNYG